MLAAVAMQLARVRTSHGPDRRGMTWPKDSFTRQKRTVSEVVATPERSVSCESCGERVRDDAGRRFEFPIGRAAPVVVVPAGSPSDFAADDASGIEGSGGGNINTAQNSAE
jgi:hypothetical protein